MGCAAALARKLAFARDLDEPVTNAVVNELNSVAELETSQQREAMTVDGLETNTERIGHLFTRQLATHNHQTNLALTIGE